jgi:exopolysaccharide biosynthesis polyprenyl glycosylphosphotransferase
MDSQSQTFPKPTWRLRPAERRSTLIFGDLVVAILALLVALYFWSQGGEWFKFSWAFLQERVPFWFYLLPVFWLLLLTESYNTRRSSIRMETFREITIAVVVCTGLYLFLFFLSEPNSLPRRGVAGFIITAYFLTLAWRLFYIQLFTAPLFMRRVLIVGAGRAGSLMAEIVKEIWPPPFFLVGLVDDDPEKIDQQVAGFPVLGGSEEFFNIVSEQQVTDLVIAITGDMNNKMFERLLEAEEQGIEVTTMPTMYEELLGRIPIFQLKSDWVLRSFVDHAHVSGFYDLAKRLVDILGGLVGGILVVITFPFIALLILIDSGAPIFYKQVRLGKNGRTFVILKYRTMVRDAEQDGIARPAQENDTRSTRIGKFLRKTHLDELPQFLNILRGDMSLVGPRSERPELVETYQQSIPFYRARLFVKPGLTGWAQVNYGYASNINENAEKLEFDLYYIKRRNLFLDLQIMIRTIGTVVGFRGR